MNVSHPFRPDRRTFLAGCGAALAVPALGRAAEGPGTIVATTGMIADAARLIAGDVATVKGLMGPGVDPHSYRQTRTDILSMTRADLVLWHGLYLEAQMEEFLLDLSRRSSVTPVGEAVPKSALLGHEDYENRFDPHIWMDPTLWIHAIRATEAALAVVWPEATDAFAIRADALTGEALALDGYARDVLSGVPDNARVLVTAHDAFRYFGAAYGFEVEGIQGISTESEAGLARIGELVDTLVERRIGAVFVESSVSDRNIRALIEGAAARGHDVRIGGELYSDAMGAPGSYEGTWIGMIDHNVTTIAGALGGAVPERGMSGLLTEGVSSHG